MSINKEQIKRDWLAALRGGDYKQGYGRLKDNEGGYCCLGVLGCVLRDKHPDVLDAVGVSLETTGADNLHFVDEGGNANCSSLPWLPWPLNRTIGLDYSMRSALISLNDDERKPFDEIADYIEDRWLPHTEVVA